MRQTRPRIAERPDGAGMATGNPHHILIDLSPSTAYWRGVIGGAIAFCRDHPATHYGLPPNGEALTDGPQAFDGVVAVVADLAAARRCAAWGKPVVNVSSIGRDVPGPSVLTDNGAIGRLAADHLLAQGYPHFAFHMESRVRYSLERFEGFRARLREAGRTPATFDSSPERGAPEAPSALRRATTEWLRDLPKPLGLMAHNDARASGLLALCGEAGLRAPEEVGVIGVDDDAFLDGSCRPTLSSVDNAPSVIGYRAAEMLVAILEGDAPPSPVLVAPRRVVQRGSTRIAIADDPLLRDAIESLRRRAFEDADVREILRDVPLSHRSLERRFQKRLGRSPAEEVRRIRLDRAKALLVETDLSVAEIAATVGYGQSRNFATAFLREVGQPPRAYRAAYGLRATP